MFKAMSNWRLGLFVGLLMFVVGSGGGIYSFEWIKSDTKTGGVGSAWIVLAMFGLLFCAVFIIWGILLSIEGLRNLQNTTKRKTVGWVFFLSGILAVVYLSQYSVTGIMPLWDSVSKSHEIYAEVFPFFITVEYVLSFIFVGVIIYAGWKIAHIKEGLQSASESPDEPGEE